MDSIRDFMEEHPHALGMAACVVFGAFYFATGGMQSWQKSQEKSAIAGATADLQRKAEDTYQKQGCAAQVLSQKTRTTSIVNGEVVIDPLSVTELNPEGSVFNGGFVCGSDGSIYSVAPGGVITLIGTSDKIRDDLVRRGAIAYAVGMEAYAKGIYDRSKQQQVQGEATPPVLVQNPIVPPPSPLPSPLPSPSPAPDLLAPTVTGGLPNNEQPPIQPR
jgi:hypothetical protein